MREIILLLESIIFTLPLLFKTQLLSLESMLIEFSRPVILLLNENNKEPSTLEGKLNFKRLLFCA